MDAKFLAELEKHLGKKELMANLNAPKSKISTEEPIPMLKPPPQKLSSVKNSSSCISVHNSWSSNEKSINRTSTGAFNQNISDSMAYGTLPTAKSSEVNARSYGTLPNPGSSSQSYPNTATNQSYPTPTGMLDSGDSAWFPSGQGEN